MTFCSKCYYKTVKVELEKKDNLTINQFNPKFYESYSLMKRDFIKFLENNPDLFALNKKGYTHLHWMAWFVATPSPKFRHHGKCSLMFFRCLKDCLPYDVYYKMLIQGTSENQGWSVLHELYDSCQSLTKPEVKELSDFLIHKMNLSIDLKDDNSVTPRMLMNKKDNLKLKSQAGYYTKKYKTEEKVFIEKVSVEYEKHFKKCDVCGILTTYLPDLVKLGEYFHQHKQEWKIFQNKYKKNITNIILYRKLVTDIFKNEKVDDIEVIMNTTEKHESVIRIYET
jgi:hypothetical protein